MLEKYLSGVGGGGVTLHEEKYLFIFVNSYFILVKFLVSPQEIKTHYLAFSVQLKLT